MVLEDFAQPTTTFSPFDSFLGKTGFDKSDELRYSSLVMEFATRTRYSKEENRERILTKADELFRQYGFAKTTVADIAVELKMSTANIYKFFPSKDAIVEASANRNIEIIETQVGEIARSGGTSAARIEEIVLTIFRFHQELFRNERQIFKMVIQAVEERWECIAEYEDFLLSTFETLLNEGRASREFQAINPGSPPVPLMDSLSIALHPHLRHSWTPDESEERVRAHIAFVLSALK